MSRPPPYRLSAGGICTTPHHQHDRFIHPTFNDTRIEMTVNYPAPQPGYGQQPQPGYPTQPPAQQFPPQGYPPVQLPPYAAPPQQPYGQPYAAPVPPQGPPPVPLAQGTLDDFYNQPSAGGGPGISWKDKPIGTTYAGIVARDVTQADIQQDTDYKTGQPQFYKDGRPKFVMKIPLRVQPSPEFPEGEVTYFVRGQSRDELVRAMGEVGAEGAPKGGAGFVVTLVERKPSRAGNPANIVRISYSPDGQLPAQAAAPAPVQQQAPVQQGYGQPAPATTWTGHDQQAQQIAQQPQQWAQPAAPVAQPAPVQQAQAPVQQPGAPVGQQMQPPAGLDPEQQQLLARLTAGQQGQPAA